MSTMKDKELSLAILLEAIHKKYGFDFNNYGKEFLLRRTEEYIAEHHYKNFLELLSKIFYDEELFQSFMIKLTVHVTEMFRDPLFFKDFREKVIPYLKTFPKITIWHAGCSTGEEAYSMAILLREEGLIEKTKIYATDLNKALLSRAKLGIYPVEKIKLFSNNYYKAGGKVAFSDYYYANYNSAIFSEDLKKNIVFLQHDLSSDAMIGHFNVILCRNVLIYFDTLLKEKVFTLFDTSMNGTGYLCLGMKETLALTGLAKKYDKISANTNIYKKLTGRSVL